MSTGRKRTSRANPTGKTTGRDARSLRKLGWKDKEIQTLPSTTKKFYLKYGIKPKPFTIKQRVLNTGVFRIAGEPTKNVAEYKEKVLTTRINRFNEPLKKGGVRNVRYLPVSEKDKDISRLRQKKAASEFGGPKLTKAETKYLLKLQEWNAGDGRKDDLKRESIIFPLRKMATDGYMKARQLVSQADERGRIENERSEQFKESVSGDFSKAKDAFKDFTSERDSAKFGPEFREARDLDRKEKSNENKFNKRGFKDGSPEKEEMDKSPEKEEMDESPKKEKMRAKGKRPRYVF